MYRLLLTLYVQGAVFVVILSDVHIFYVPVPDLAVVKKFYTIDRSVRKE